jgi:Fe2+ or Zn2+ uptake regulation protein
MKDKDLVMRAIDSYASYTEPRRRLLKILVGIASEGIAVISVAELHQVTKVTKAAIYATLKVFQNDEIIEPVKNQDGSLCLNSFKINMSKLDLIVKHYLTKQSFL